MKSLNVSKSQASVNSNYRSSLRLPSLPRASVQKLEIKRSINTKYNTLSSVDQEVQMMIFKNSKLKSQLLEAISNAEYKLEKAKNSNKYAKPVINRYKVNF